MFPEKGGMKRTKIYHNLILHTWTICCVSYKNNVHSVVSGKPREVIKTFVMKSHLISKYIKFIMPLLDRIKPSPAAPLSYMLLHTSHWQIINCRCVTAASLCSMPLHNPPCQLSNSHWQKIFYMLPRRRHKKMSQ